MSYKYRNPRYNHLGTIDCEIKHPIYGWIPFTASPDDVEPLGKEIFDAVLATRKITPYSPSPINGEDVNVERDKRLAAGFVFNGVLYQSRPQDRENIANAMTTATAAILTGAVDGDYRWHGGDQDFAWIAADNSTHKMDAKTVIELGKAAAAHKQKLITACRAIKEMSPIPTDYTDDKYWN